MNKTKHTQIPLQNPRNTVAVETPIATTCGCKFRDSAVGLTSSKEATKKAASRPEEMRVETGGTRKGRVLDGKQHDVTCYTCMDFIFGMR